MGSTITLGKDEWEDFLRDSELLIRKYNSLFRELNEVEKSRGELEQRLELAKTRIRLLEEERRNPSSTLDRRKTLVDDVEGKMLIPNAERENLFDGTERVHQLRLRVRRLNQVELPKW